MKNSPKPSVHHLSKRAFWDTPLSNLNSEQHGVFILERIMRYGTVDDWKLLSNLYSKEDLKQFATEAKDLDTVSISFLCIYLEMDKKDFKCYTESPSTKNFWTF